MKVKKEEDHIKVDMEYPEDMRADFTIDQGWDQYSSEEHDVWRQLHERQLKLLPGRACQEYLDGVKRLGIEPHAGIPNFEKINKTLYEATRWQIVAVPGLIPDDAFFDHLANRRFPVTNWVRKPEQMDYLQEPDVFHDFFGHVPILLNPVFADYMEAYGRGGLKALRLDGLKYLARLYWYTVEFGLIMTDEGLRIYGAGILSSKGECFYCLDDPTPNRIYFNTLRIMQTEYRIDDFQETYFVIESFDQLFDATRPDFGSYYDFLKGTQAYAPGRRLPGDYFVEID